MERLQSFLLWIIALPVYTGDTVSAQLTSVRLVPGPTHGVVEIEYGGSWGTLCTPFTNQAATVACRSMALPSYNAYRMEPDVFTVTPRSAFISNVTCNGHETSLEDCTYATNDIQTCLHPAVITAVKCTNDAVPLVFTTDNPLMYFDPAVTPVLKVIVGFSPFVHCQAGNGSARGFTCGPMGEDSDKYCLTYGLNRTMPIPLQVTCVLSNWQYPNQTNASILIDALYVPEWFVESHVSVIEHSTANVTVSNLCNPPPYEYEWTRLGTKEKTVSDIGYMEFIDIRRKDAGVYFIQMRNRLEPTGSFHYDGKGQELLTLNILYKPTLTCDKEYVVLEGSVSTITCSVDASPSPYEYNWTNPRGAVVAQGSEPSLTLTINDLVPSGLYKVTAQNTMNETTGSTSIGAGSAKFTVKVVLKPTSTTPVPRASFSTVTTSSALKQITSVSFACLAVAVIVVIVLIVVVVRNKRKKREREEREGITNHLPEEREMSRMASDDSSDDGPYLQIQHIT